MSDDAAMVVGPFSFTHWGRGAGLAICTTCRALVLPDDTMKHVDWHKSRGEVVQPGPHEFVCTTKHRGAPCDVCGIFEDFHEVTWGA